MSSNIVLQITLQLFIKDNRSPGGEGLPSADICGQKQLRESIFHDFVRTWTATY